MLDKNSVDNLSIFETLDRIKKLAEERNRMIAEKKECDLCYGHNKCWWHRSGQEHVEFMRDKNNARN